jgi:thiamine monophosphate kinase
MLDSPGNAATDLSVDGLIKYCESIASASGGMFGIGRISAEEREALAKIASALKGK